MTAVHDANCATDDDIQIARQVMEDGDFQHAAFHVAAALAASPQDADALALADALLRRSADPFSLAPIKRDENFVGTVALRARFLQQKSRHDEALSLIVGMLRATGKLGFLEWGCASIRALGDKLALPTLHDLARQVWTTFVAEAASKDDRRRLAEFCTVLRALEQSFGGSGDFLTLGSLVLRKAGDLAGALAWGQRAYAAQPDFMSALAVASTLRQQPEAFDDYLRWIEITAGHETDDKNTALLDLGDALLGVRRYEEAASAFTRALDKVPDHPWATPSLFYAKAHLPGVESRSWCAKLVDYARDNPANEQAQILALRAQPWTHYLPTPEDASIDGLRRSVAAKSDLTKATIRVSALEAPSCYLAFRLEAQRQGRNIDLTVAVGEIQKPDPRESRAEKQFELWRYRSWSGLKTDAKVCGPPPDPKIRAGIAAIAEQPYELGRWCALGRAYAAEIGPGRIGDVLATMVHPSLPPEELPSWVWLQRLQFAACCTIAGVGAGWEGTLRRRALLSLLRGPLDWINGAAAMVLSEIYIDCVPARPEIMKELWDQLQRLPNAYACCRKPFAAAFLRLPGTVPAHLVEALQRWVWN
jgi:tetratricopeptide (TPR) repeat protein